MMKELNKFDVYFNNFKSYFIEIEFETQDSVKGGLEKDISIAEESISGVLPAAYKSWLRVFGLDMSKKLFDGNYITISALLEASKQACKDKYDIINYQDALFIKYEDTTDCYTILSSGFYLDDPKVSIFIAGDDLFQEGNYFTSWIRESIIKMMKILNHLKLMSFNKEWLTLDSFYARVNDAENINYNKQREAFTSIIENRDHQRGIITMPDDFQQEWISYIKDNGMNDYINWNYKQE
ncbi:hypothetical protein [Chondrinema litorale]|uniref:hypothetical protein n=1 Tax=Chondrinema litorale TaxID=2994555 RepID=UPI00254291BE|nr:hypothetical protein [Chondrinema litorale]UZR99758.1 hypothetical protein OQ292_37780 [Chondrinema litorale]